MGGLPGERGKKRALPVRALPGAKKMDYEKQKEEIITERMKEYTALMSLAYSVMDADDKIRDLVRVKMDAEEKYQRAKKAYYEKYPGDL
jgi:hypothetical protein